MDETAIFRIAKNFEILKQYSRLFFILLQNHYDLWRLRYTADSDLSNSLDIM